jgi:hypothetical protein
MRLINVQTLKLEEFFDSNIPPYGILSHTWGLEEVTFQDLERPDHVQKTGYAKIKNTCKLVKVQSLSYVWIDTCCIDKTSSVELSESINSMFRWYQNAEVCYVFLSDVWSSDEPEDLAKSHWFYRGWTLQELLAPTRLNFYSKTWRFLFTRGKLAPTISKITGIAASTCKTTQTFASSSAPLALLSA